MYRKYLKAWSFMRVLRLAAGAYILIQGIITHDWIFMVVGAFFAALPMLNIGCGCSDQCYSTTNNMGKGAPSISEQKEPPPSVIISEDASKEA